LSRTRKYTEDDIISLLTFVLQGHYSGRDSYAAFRFWANKMEYYLERSILKK